MKAEETEGEQTERDQSQGNRPNPQAGGQASPCCHSVVLIGGWQEGRGAYWGRLGKVDGLESPEIGLMGSSWW